MNKWKKLLILVCIFLCTACDIKYSVSLKKDNISEGIQISNLKFNSDSSLMSPVEFFFQKKIYNYQYNDKLLSANKTFNDFTSYNDGSLLYYFIPNGITIKGNKINIDLQVNDEIKRYISSFGNIDNLEISLYIPYYVSKHNATSVNNNTYTWKIDNIEKAHLKVSFDMGKDKNFIRNVISIVIVVIFVLAILFVGIFLYVKNKKNNEI